MLEVYSTNVTTGINTSIPLSNTKLVKGRTAVKDGDTILLNNCGVYEVNVGGAVTIPTGTTVNVTLTKDNVSDVGTTITGTADNVIPFSFTTLIQVPFNNTPSPCTSPVALNILSDVAATYNKFNVVVTKLV